jgi:prepilin-type N-terminal cleavage/methylation domain-containing protein
MKNKSFTLIELLVVIVIIGILAGVIMISTSSSIDKANFAKAQAFSSTVQNELLSNLVSEWTFDSDTVSNKTEDTWGNNHGTVVGTLQYYDSSSGNCVFGGCYNFSGDDYIDCGNRPSFNFTFGGITITSWVKRNTIGASMRILDKGGQSNSNYDYSMGFGSADKIFFGAVKTSDVISNRTDSVDKYASTTEWMYIVGTYDENSIKIYVNGALIKTTTTGTLSNTSIDALHLGQKVDGTQKINAVIDDVRIYNAALSSSQIKQNYIAGLNSMLANGNISKQEYNERINALAYDN